MAFTAGGDGLGRPTLVDGGDGSYSGSHDKRLELEQVEKGIVVDDVGSSSSGGPYLNREEEPGVHGEEGSTSDIFATPFGRFFAPLRRVEQILDHKMGVETQGPARVLPDERTKPRVISMCAMWISATMNLSAFATGLIGSQLQLDLSRTIPIAICATLAGAIMAGWCSTQGPKTGLRQISISRYSMGWWPSKLIALLNFVQQLGWASVGCIAGGLALTAVSDGRVSLAPGVIIVTLIAFALSFFGLRVLLRYEMYAWIPIFIIYLVIYGEAGPRAALDWPTPLKGADLSGACLTWFSIVYGSTSSWAVVVSDYYVQYPVETSGWLTFSLTVLGMTVSTSFAIVLGALVGSTTLVDQDWNDANTAGLGYLIQKIVYPYGFAKFILVLLVLSGIGNACLCIYSASLSAQQFIRPFMAVPRTLWTIVVLACVLLLGLVGRDHLSEYLSYFLALLGYWNTSFVVILFTEHYLFRKGDYAYYDLTAWNDRRRMPIGFAGGFAFCVGLAGWVTGMSEQLYSGPIALKIGSAGGDVGNELSLAFTAIAYPPARWLEYKIVGR